MYIAVNFKPFANFVRLIEQDAKPSPKDITAGVSPTRDNVPIILKRLVPRETRPWSGGMAKEADREAYRKTGGGDKAGAADPCFAPTEVRGGFGCGKPLLDHPLEQ